MGKLWPLNGPDKDTYTLAELAVMLGYESAETVRRLVAEGKLPAPRGHGTAQFYTGSDVACIWEMFGRWSPATKIDEKPQKPSKTDEKPQAQ
jgi:hypothetical protein